MKRVAQARITDYIRLMQEAFRKLLAWMPLLFGIGFIAPLIAELAAVIGWHPPFGVSRIVFGLAIGGPLGLLAIWRGRWI